MKKTLALILVLVTLIPAVQVWGWSGFSPFNIQWVNDHGKLAEKAEQCRPLPRPPQKRCEKPVDDDFLYTALKIGAAEPDEKDGETTTKHSFNPKYRSDWDPAIKVKHPGAVSINAGTALGDEGDTNKGAIKEEIDKAKKALAGLTCDSGQKEYEDLWKQFGRLSHYPADLTSPLHAYSVGIIGFKEGYHEGDYIGGKWVNGLYDATFLGISGRYLHWLSELALGAGAGFDKLACGGSVPPKSAASSSMAVVNGYLSPLGSGSGFLGMVKDFENYGNIDLGFFRSIGAGQAGLGVGAIRYAWNEAFKDFTPPSNCDDPPGKCGDCESGGSCSPPGGDHPDDTASVSASSEPPASEELLEQAWIRMAAKKDKRSLTSSLMRSYLLGQYTLGKMDEATYRERTEGLLAPAVADELLYQDYITTPDAAILGRGFALSTSDLLQKVFLEPVRRFKVSHFSPDALKDYPVLVIPSGGLMGLESSEGFKASLNEYVKRGGTLVVFAQQNGYEYAVLPTPDGKPVTAYGWTEDQSCQFASSYIDTWHQVLASLAVPTPSINVDGYFTSYPADSAVLLRRTSNGQPAALLYAYGNGHVIATTFYSDFGFASGQASAEEKALIRDIVAWAKKPTSLPEIRPGETVSLAVSVNNNAVVDAASVKVLIYDPDRKGVLSEQTMSQPVPAGGSSLLAVEYTSSPDAPLGIYHADYVLSDASGTAVQPQTETDSGRFAVSNPPNHPYKSASFDFSVQSDAEYYLHGTPATFTFRLWNNTSSDRSIRVTWGVPHHDWSGGLWGAFEKIVAVPANGGTSFTYVLDSVRALERLRAIFYDESGKQVGYADKGIWMFYPSGTAVATTDKNLYAKGDTVTIAASLKNDVHLAWPASVRFSVFDSKASTVFEDAKTVTLFPFGTGSLSTSFVLPQTASLGMYSVRVDVHYGSMAWPPATASARFELPRSQVSTKPTLPTVLSPGANVIPFVLKNTGKVGVSSGKLDVALKDPDGADVFSGSHPFALAVGETKTIEVPATIPALKFGHYVIVYSQSDETQSGYPVKTSIPNTVTSIVSLDKRSYRIRESASLTVALDNLGMFNQGNMSVAVAFSDTGYADTKLISLPSGQSGSASFVIPIPETLAAGWHDVSVTVTLPSGSSIVRTDGFAIPQSSVAVQYAGPASLASGDAVQVDVSNPGGVDANLTYRITVAGAGAPVCQSVGSDVVEAGATKGYSCRIHPQASAGSYLLEVQALDTKTGKAVGLSKTLTISGLTADLSVKTGKDIYLSTESITVLSRLVNGPYPIDNANLHLQIVSKCVRVWEGPPLSYHVSTRDGASWAERGVLHFPNTLETQLIDLSAFLPDPSGEYKVRIKHTGSEDARIDYLGLRVDGVLPVPGSAVNLSTGEDILASVAIGDNWTASVLNNEAEIIWTGVPASASKILLMRAQEGAVDYSACQEWTYWQEDIPVTHVANAAADLSRMVNPLSQAGQFFLQGTLRSRTGQVIAQAEYAFTVVDGDLALRLKTDKSVYRPGEAAQFTGDVVNLAGIEATGITVTIQDNAGTTLYTETFNVPAGGSRPFAFAIVAGSEGSYQISGDLAQGASWLASARAKYVVALPKVTASASAPSVVGRDPFALSLTLQNTGLVPATVQISAAGGSLSDTQSVALNPQESRLIQYTQVVTQDTTYTITLTGDLSQVLTLPVAYGEKASLTLSAQAIYPEGRVSPSATIRNTGQVDEALQVTFKLDKGGTSVSEQTKTYFLSPGASVTEILSFDLTEGSYQLSAISTQPSASATVDFAVRKENRVDLSVSVGAQSAGSIPVAVGFSNLGYNEVAGRALLSVKSSQNAEVWAGEEGLASLLPQAAQSLTFNLKPASFKPGDYSVTAVLLSPSGQETAAASTTLKISGPSFKITELPPDQTVTASQPATFTFKVRNAGDQEGAFELAFKAYDLIDSAQRERLKAGEEKAVTFTFLLPADLEEADHFASCRLRSVETGATLEEGRVKYHLAGIKLGVTAVLDKPVYNEGDTARLTLTVTQQGAGTPNLSSRVNYAGYETRQSFSLAGAQTLVFDIPLTRITGEKLFYGIYHESGRSLRLNSLYIHKAGDLTITTDRQVYKPGETVAVSVAGSPGTITLSGPGYSESFALTGSAARSFALPAQMTAGTYFINAELQTQNSELRTASYPFDVAGLSVKVKEATLDKGRYAASDTLKLTLTIESNQDLPAILRTWVVDPEGKYTPAGEGNISLVSTGPFLATMTSSSSTTVSGIHRLVYGIYAGDLTLVTGSEAFDVGDAVLMSLSTDKPEYPMPTDPVTYSAGLYGKGAGSLDIYVDNQLVQTASVTLSDFSTHTGEVSSLSPGTHTLKAVLTQGGLTSTKTTRFVYGSSLPDLTVQGLGAGAVSAAAIRASAMVINQGRTPSQATDLALYDGDPSQGGSLIAALSVPALDPGGSAFVTYDFVILGKAGKRTLFAVADRNNAVIELDETNNTESLDLTLPDVTAYLSVDPAYKANQSVRLAGAFANLASIAFENLTATFEVKTLLGQVLHSESKKVPLLSPGQSLELLSDWNTAQNPPGTYVAALTVTGGAGAILAASQARFEVLPTVLLKGGLGVSPSPVHQGQKVDFLYVATNGGNVDLEGVVIKIQITDPVSQAVKETLSATANIPVGATVSGALSTTTLNLPPKLYRATLEAEVGADLIPLAGTTFEVKPGIEAANRVPDVTNLLVWVNEKCGEGEKGGSGETEKGKKGQDCIRLDLLEAVLKEAAMTYKLVFDKKDFQAEMRNLYHTDLLILGQHYPMEDHFAEELREQVYSGKGLVSSLYLKHGEEPEHGKDDEDLSLLFGLTYKGHLSGDAHLVILLDSPVSQAGTLTAKGKALKVEVLDSTRIAAWLTDTHHHKDDKQYPGIVLNGFGLGKTVFFAFDLGATLSEETQTTLKALIRGSLAYVHRPRDTAAFHPFDLAPVEIILKSLGAAFDLRLTETYPDGIKIYDPVTGKWITDNPWAVNIHLEPNETKRVLYYALLPDQAGTHTLGTQVAYSEGGVYTPYQELHLDLIVAEDSTTLAGNVIQILKAIPAAGEDQERINEAIKHLEKVQARTVATREDTEENIHDILKAVELLPVANVDISGKRLILDALLRAWEGQWYIMQ